MNRLVLFTHISIQQKYEHLLSMRIWSCQSRPANASYSFPMCLNRLIIQFWLYWQRHSAELKRLSISGILPQSSFLHLFVSLFSEWIRHWDKTRFLAHVLHSFLFKKILDFRMIKQIHDSNVSDQTQSKSPLTCYSKVLFTHKKIQSKHDNNYQNMHDLLNQINISDRDHFITKNKQTNRHEN